MNQHLCEYQHAWDPKRVQSGPNSMRLCINLVTHTQNRKVQISTALGKNRTWGESHQQLNQGQKKYRKIVWTQHNNLSFPCSRKTCLCPLFLSTDLSSGTTSPSFQCFKTPNGVSKLRVTSLLSLPVLSGDRTLHLLSLS